MAASSTGGILLRMTLKSRKGCSLFPVRAPDPGGPLLGGGHQALVGIVGGLG